MNRRRLTIVVVTFIVLIGGGILVTTLVSKNNQSTVITDRDTGESYDPAKPEVNTGGGSTSYGKTILFGITSLTKKDLDNNRTVGYIDSIGRALWKYGDNRLNEEFPTLTLIPNSITINDSSVQGQVRLGQTDTTVPIKAIISPDRKTSLVTINENGSSHNGTFVYVGGIDNPNNYLFTVTQKDDKTSDLVVQTYTGYREAALTYIESLGYNVPDFSITFTNYENPFK